MTLCRCLVPSVVFAVALVAGCSSAPTPRGDAGSAAGCPSAPPTNGAACDASGLRCVYDRCGTSGVIVGTCAPADGGAPSWTVTTTPCATCVNGQTCAAGTVCMQNQAGAQIAMCAAHQCGQGPLACDCACGVGVDCRIEGGPSTPVLFTCYVGCGAAICP
jgi:hypothetical protein